MTLGLKIDEISYWSEIKLDILKDYAREYNKIICKKKLQPIYIDGFAGAGRHKAKGSDRMIAGSPQHALDVQPPFVSLHFVDTNTARIQELTRLAKGRKNVYVHHGDCNEILIKDVFPSVRYDQYQRALCILDPYGLDLDWKVIQSAADTKAIEIFLNFPVMDMQMNVFWRNYKKVDVADRKRMTRFWGDETWEKAAYQSSPGLFEDMKEKADIKIVVEAFRERLKKVAGFQHVPQPIPMRNSKGATVYYLFFATHKPVAGKIVSWIFNKYKTYGSVDHV